MDFGGKRYLGEKGDHGLRIVYSVLKVDFDLILYLFDQEMSDEFWDGVLDISHYQGEILVDSGSHIHNEHLVWVHFAIIL